MEAILAQYGLTGAVLGVIFTVLRTLYKREMDRADRAEAELRQINVLVRDQLVPVVIRGTEAIAQVTEVLSEWRHQRGYSQQPGPAYPGTTYGTPTPYMAPVRPPTGRHWAFGSEYDQP